MLTRVRGLSGKANFHAGRRTVALAVLVGIAAFVYLVAHEDQNLYSGFMKALAATLFTMVVVSVADNFVSRDQKVDQAAVHAGPDGIDVDVSFAAKITEAADQLREGMKEQMVIVDGRLARLETAIFKKVDDSAEEEE